MICSRGRGVWCLPHLFPCFTPDRWGILGGIPVTWRVYHVLGSGWSHATYAARWSLFSCYATYFVACRCGRSGLVRSGSPWGFKGARSLIRRGGFFIWYVSYFNPFGYVQGFKPASCVVVHYVGFFVDRFPWISVCYWTVVAVLFVYITIVFTFCP